MKNLIKNTIFLFILGFVSAQDCVDDPTGAFLGFGGCDEIVNQWGMGCDAEFLGTPISEECPVSCGTCPPECDENGPTSHGCCLPDFNLYITEDGSVFYNTSKRLEVFSLL